MFDLVEELGGRIVLDATDIGERGMPEPFDHDQVRHDPLGALVAAYFGGITHAFRRPNSALYHWLKDRLTDRGVKGIILPRCLGCDTWHAEQHRIKQETNLPVLDLVLADGADSKAHMAGRLQAFMEMLA